MSRPKDTPARKRKQEKSAARRVGTQATTELPAHPLGVELRREIPRLKVKARFHDVTPACVNCGDRIARELERLELRRLDLLNLIAAAKRELELAEAVADSPGALQARIDGILRRRCGMALGSGSGRVVWSAAEESPETAARMALARDLSESEERLRTLEAEQQAIPVWIAELEQLREEIGAIGTMIVEPQRRQAQAAQAAGRAVERRHGTKGHNKRLRCIKHMQKVLEELATARAEISIPEDYDQLRREHPKWLIIEAAKKSKKLREQIRALPERSGRLEGLARKIVAALDGATENTVENYWTHKNAVLHDAHRPKAAPETASE